MSPRAAADLMDRIPHVVDTLSAAIATILTGGVAFFFGWEGGVRACMASAAYRPKLGNRLGGNSRNAPAPQVLHVQVVAAAVSVSGGIAYAIWKWRSSTVKNVRHTFFNTFSS